MHVAGSSAHWSEAEASADIGFPARGGPVRRIVGKLLWPFLGRQVAVNRALLAELDVVRGRLDAAEHRLDRVFGDLEHHTAVLVRHEEPLERHEMLLPRLQTNLEALQHEFEPAIVDLIRQIDVSKDMFNLGQRQTLTRFLDGMAEIHSEMGEMRAELETFRSRRHGYQGALEDVWLRLAQLDLFLTEARRAFPAAPEPSALATIASGFDALYATFTEAFRGPESVVKDRIRPYVEDLRAAPTGLPVLDLGAGRGELLELLAEAEIPAYGVDSNSTFVRRAEEKGLDVRKEDARAHLRTLAPGSVGAVVGIHFADRVAPDELIELLELAARAVASGGVVLFESPNPENLVVGATSAYLDPSVRRPVPPTLLAFLVESRGFTDVEIRRLHRDEELEALARPKQDEAWAEDVAPLVDAVNFHLFGPSEYAVIARRP
jgi:O-antigen chain-terminating methyltransferase